MIQTCACDQTGKSSRFASKLFFGLLLAVTATRMAAVELHLSRTANTDLVVRGGLVGVLAGEDRFVRWADLRALPQHEFKLAAEFFPGEQTVSVIFLDELLKELPVAADTDAILATCADGYASVYRFDFIARCRPFLVLEINGLSPDKWPPPGLKFNPAPYVISVSASIAPPVAELLDPGHKKPWGVTAIELAKFDDRFHEAFAGKWASLSPRAGQGREIWVNSCASCHAGPGGIFGGTKSGQPFLVLETLAKSEPAFFRSYVRHPKEVNPTAHMEAHPHYTDVQLDALAAFIMAEPPK